VPTVTSPKMVFVTLLRILVSPSLTTCARSAGAATSVTAKTDVTMKRNDALCRIPTTGFQHSAQGCEQRATLGLHRKHSSTPIGLRPFPSICHNSVGVGILSICTPRVARCSQPCAEPHHPF